MIICITGLAGSGKTTIANLLDDKLQKLNYKVLRYNTDFIREQLYIDEYLTENLAGRDFTDDELKRSYNGLYMLMRESFRANANTIVITDGMYRKTTQRLYLKLIADRLKIPFKLIKANTLAANAKARLLKRSETEGLGGWVDPKEYEEPEYENAILVNNNGEMANLDVQLDKIISLIGLQQYCFV